MKCQICELPKSDVEKWYFNEEDKSKDLYTYLCSDCKSDIEESIDEVGFGYNPEADYDD